MNSPSFNGASRLSPISSNCFKVEDQQKDLNFSGQLSRLNQNHQDMSSVAQLQGVSHQALKQLEQPRPTMLLNSPTFNTLDNRFVDSSSNPLPFTVGQGEITAATQSPEPTQNHKIQQIFAESTWMPPVIHSQQKHSDTELNSATDEGPRMASPTGFVPQRGQKEQQKPLLSSLLHQGSMQMEQNRVLEPILNSESFASNANRSQKSTGRKQPSQRGSLLDKKSASKERKNSTMSGKKGSISPSRHSRIPRMVNESKAHSRNSTPYRKNHAETFDDPHKGLMRTLNVVSSDTFKENSPYNPNNSRSRAQLANHQRGKTHDGYKKMNKEPYAETVKFLQKHSAQQVSRSRIPSIAQTIEIEADLNRLNLKTREENMNKRNQLIQTAVQARDSFDISANFSPQRMDTSGFSTHLKALKHRRNRDQDKFKSNTIQQDKNNQIETNFLKQSEMLRIKPDGFRRISIQTDLEFGGMTADQVGGIGQKRQSNLQPLSASRVTNTPILELEHERGQEEDGDFSDWGGHMTDSQSSSFLPRTRRVMKAVKIRESVLQSRHQSTHLNEMMSQNHRSGMTPSIRKALKERTNFYRRKLDFYENLDVLAVSMTSNEIQEKLKEPNPDFNQSNANSLLNQLAMRCTDSASNSAAAAAPPMINNRQVFSQEDEKRHMIQTQQMAKRIVSPNSILRLPQLSETPAILSGTGDPLIADPVQQTDFRLKDMTLRRSRILQTILPISSTTNESACSKLPKSLPNPPQHRTETQTAMNDAPTPDLDEVSPTKSRQGQNKGVRIFSILIAAKAESASRECSLPSASGERPMHLSIPKSRGRFQRVNIPEIVGTPPSSQQVWRRIASETPMRQQNVTTMPELTDVRRKMPELKADLRMANAKINRNGNVSMTQRKSVKRDLSELSPNGSGIRDVIKDLLARQPAQLPKKRVLTKEDRQKMMLPPTSKRNKLSNKLKVSPLNQELKRLEPLIPLQAQPVFVKYSHRELEVMPKRVSPNTRVDPDKPRLINKAKAQKLVLLQNTINQM